MGRDLEDLIRDWTVRISSLERTVRELAQSHLESRERIDVITGNVVFKKGLDEQVGQIADQFSRINDWVSKMDRYSTEVRDTLSQVNDRVV